MPEIQKHQSNTFLLLTNKILPVTTNWFENTFWKDKEVINEQASGRGNVQFIDTEFGQFAIRQYLRGGLIKKFVTSHFLFLGTKLSRPYQELALLEYMQAQKLPTAEPIAAICKKEGLGYQASIMTRIIPNAAELFTVILTSNSKNSKWPKINWYVVGLTIKRFHDAGIDHADLNCHNIMLDNDNKIWLIDFDKCQHRKTNGSWQKNNLARLKRSLDKESQLNEAFQYQDSDWQRLLEGYHG